MKIESPVLRRLGPVPFWRGTAKCLDELQRIYIRAARHADETLRTAEPATRSADGPHSGDRS